MRQKRLTEQQFEERRVELQKQRMAALSQLSAIAGAEQELNVWYNFAFPRKDTNLKKVFASNPLMAVK